MKISFSKYQGTGNDFVMIDNREGKYSTLDQLQIAKLCNRHFGIGADGLILLEISDTADFYMRYYNSDGAPSSMCGNGGRCVAVFARDLGIVATATTFDAVDGHHCAAIDGNEVELSMQNVNGIAAHNDAFILNTGSPHYVTYVSKAADINVAAQGAAIRYSPDFEKKGINVNFVEVRSDKSLQVATYERGVEAETLSCGTGVTAAALVQVRDSIGSSFVRVLTKGGLLMVKCVHHGNGDFTDISLSGNASKVYDGVVEV